MSSLALQLFVNLNKILGQFPGASPGANYAKQLVDRLKLDHPQLLACSDPTNAHTHALSAFALGVGLKELRAQNAEQAQALAPALAYALEIADEGLEQLGEEEVHLVLTAHEYYKSHCSGKGAQDDYSRATWGKARSATDQIPLATVQGPGEQDTLGWRPAAMKEMQDTPPKAPVAHVEFAASLAEEDITHRAPVSQMDLGSIALPEIEMASTGASSFFTEEVIPPLDTHEDDDTPEDPIAEEVTFEDAMEAAQIDKTPAIFATTPAPSYHPETPAIAAATLHPVRRDLGAEREFTNGNNGELVEETITAWGNRQRDRARQEDIPHGGWQGPHAARADAHRPLGRYAHDLPAENDDSQISGGSETYDSTFMHSESAPDRRQRRKGEPEPRRTRTLLIWALAPLCLALPPAAFFQAGVLWTQGRKGHSALLMALGAIGSAVFILIGLQKI